MKPYQQRVIDEKRELDGKLCLLNKFLATNAEAVPKDERERLYAQSRIMTEYSKILGERIAEFY